MTREEHIKAAQRLVEGKLLDGCYWATPSPEEVAQAQVHATIALAMLPDVTADESAAQPEPAPTETPRRPWWVRMVTR